MRLTTVAIVLQSELPEQALTEILSTVLALFNTKDKPVKRVRAT